MFINQVAVAMNCTINGVPATSEECSAMMGTFGDIFFAVFIVWALILAGVYVLFSILMMKMFKKFGVEGWKAWVPFVNTWTFFELGGQHGWWQFVPGANIIFQIIAAYNIGLKFGKDGAFVVLYIFLSPIWMIIMALKSTTLVGGQVNEIGITGLGVTPDQTVFANSNGSVNSGAVGSAGVVPTEDFTKPAEPEITLDDAPVASIDPVADETPSPVDESVSPEEPVADTPFTPEMPESPVAEAQPEAPVESTDSVVTTDIVDAPTTPEDTSDDSGLSAGQSL